MSKLDTPEFPQIERFSRSLLHRVFEPKFAKLCSMYERGRGSIFDKQCETNCNKPVSSGQSFQSYVLVKIMYQKWKYFFFIHFANLYKEVLFDIQLLPSSFLFTFCRVELNRFITPKYYTFSFISFSHSYPTYTRKGWCPRTGKGQRLMGILAVTEYGSV